MTDEVLRSVAGGVATVTINRPERRNALSWAVIAELREVLATLRDDPEVRVVVLTGAGDKAFCAGADLGGMADGASFLELHEGRGGLADLFLDLWALGKPTIARVRGFALAGGMGLALACDFVVASDDAQFGTPEIDVGLIPALHFVQLPRLIGKHQAFGPLFLGDPFDAATAFRMGLVSEVVPTCAHVDARVGPRRQT